MPVVDVGRSGLSCWLLLSVLRLDRALERLVALRDEHVYEVERIIVYVAAVGVPSCSLGGQEHKRWLWGCGERSRCSRRMGLRSGSFPQHLGFEAATYRDRLSAPVGFWNTVGILAAMGMLLALGLAARGRALVLRATAGASTVILLVTLYFTFSRGGWLALAAGLIAAFALDQRRLQLATTALVLVPWAGLAVFAASRSSALTHANSSLAAVERDGHGLAVILIGLTASGETVAMVLLDTVESRASVPRSLSRVFAALLILVIAVAVGAVFVKYGSPPTLARRAYHAFNSAPVGDRT